MIKLRKIKEVLIGRTRIRSFKGNLFVDVMSVYGQNLVGFLAEVEFYVQLVMFDFDVLVQRTLGSVGALAGLNGTSVMPLDLIGSPPKPLLLIIISPLSFLYFPRLALQLLEARRKVITLIVQFPHLREEDNVGEMQPTVLMVVAEVSISLLTHR